MAQTVATFMLDRIREWGIRQIYGYPGDGINGFLGAFHELGDDPRFIQTRHEEIAAFAATGHAKWTGEVTCCLATSGPGAIHLLNGLYDAKLDHQPVVAIIGQQKRMSLGANYQQEVDLQVLFKDVCGEFVQTVMAPPAARHIVDRAVRVAQSERAPTCIIVPADVQEAEYESPPRVHGAVYAGKISRPRMPVVRPPADELDKAAEILNSSEKVAILIGQGAKHAAAEVEQVADVLGTGVAKALNGRAALPDDKPFVTGAVGLLGTKPSNEMMENCDCLFMIGTNFPYSEWLPEEGQARGVQIELDAKLAGIRYPMDATLIGDSKETLQALMPLLRRKEDRSWRQHLESEIERWWDILAERAMQDASTTGLINPQRIYHELSPRLPDRCILTADSGSATNWWARHLKLREGMQAALSGTLATMCPALPYAFAAKFAHPDRPVVATLGDGAMQMLGMNALIDVAHYWEGWQDPRLITILLTNHDLNQVTWEQRVLAGDPKLEASQSLPDVNFADFARALGLEGIRVESTDQVPDAIETALRATKPIVLDFVVDPEVPPLPPHIRFDQASSMAQALVRGDENAGRIMKQSIKGKLAEFTTRS